MLDEATVFQAEIEAIYQSTQFLLGLDTQIKYVKILCDSQAALLALDNVTVKSQTVLKTIHSLNALAHNTICVRLVWIKAHVGHPGNEEADMFAKDAAYNTVVQSDTPIPWKHKLRQIEAAINAEWANRWENIQGHRHSKIFLTKPDAQQAKKIINLPRMKLTLLIRALTNHNFLGEHQHRIDPNISRCCRLCEEENETFAHLLHTCPALHTLKNDIYLDKHPTAGEDWSLRKLMQFITSQGILAALSSKDGLSVRDDHNEIVDYDSDIE